MYGVEDTVQGMKRCKVLWVDSVYSKWGRFRMLGIRV